MNTIFYKSFIFSIMLNGSTVETIEGCNGSTIKIEDNSIKIELIMPNNTIRKINNKILDNSEYPTLWIDKGFLILNSRPNGEAEYTKLINEKNNQYINIIFRNEDCVDK